MIPRKAYDKHSFLRNNCTEIVGVTMYVFQTVTKPEVNRNTMHNFLSKDSHHLSRRNFSTDPVPIPI